MLRIAIRTRAGRSRFRSRAPRGLVDRAGAAACAQCQERRDRCRRGGHANGFAGKFVSLHLLSENFCFFDRQQDANEGIPVPHLLIHLSCIKQTPVILPDALIRR
jgi:hypothetical protein